MDALTLVCAFIGAAWIGNKSMRLLIFIVAGKKLRITHKYKDGTKSSVTIRYRPLDSVHRDLLKIKWKGIKAA